MPVQIYNNQRKVQSERDQWDKVFDLALIESGHENDIVEVSFVSNRAIALLNRQWRFKTGPTDCLSFPFAPDVPFPDGSGPKPLGDIVISLEQALIQGSVHVENEIPGYGPLFSEVLFLFIHSLLHLIGYDHETGTDDAKRMEAEQLRIFNSVVSCI